jgi:hypothetical protein
MEKRKGSVFYFIVDDVYVFFFSLYFFDEEFYTDVKTLNEQENGGVGVVLGRKVGGFFLKNFHLFFFEK